VHDPDAVLEQSSIAKHDFGVEKEEGMLDGPVAKKVKNVRS
jgi:hypothetical protein